MPKITFVQADGSAQTFEGSAGQSVMELATANLVRGIIGECGGSCSCATCHVYVDEPWFSGLPPARDDEKGMLEGAVEPGPGSRLSCQLRIGDALDGIVCRIPAGQA